MYRIIKHVTEIKDLTNFLHMASLETHPILHNEVALWQLVRPHQVAPSVSDLIDLVELKRPICTLEMLERRAANRSVFTIIAPFHSRSFWPLHNSSNPCDELWPPLTPKLLRSTSLIPHRYLNITKIKGPFLSLEAIVNYQGMVVAALQDKANMLFQVVLEEERRILEKCPLPIVGKLVLPVGKALVQIPALRE